MKFSEIVSGNCVRYGDDKFVATSDARLDAGACFVDGFIVDGDLIRDTRWFSNSDDDVQLIEEKYELN